MEHLGKNGAELDAIPKQLIEQANNGGGSDNITLGLCKVE
jgi:serine/threonine protein phosphatase PrpC